MTLNVEREIATKVKTANIPNEIQKKITHGASISPGLLGLL